MDGKGKEERVKIKMKMKIIEEGKNRSKRGSKEDHGSADREKSARAKAGDFLYRPNCTELGG